MNYFCYNKVKSCIFFINGKRRKLSACKLGGSHLCGSLGTAFSYNKKRKVYTVYIFPLCQLMFRL